MSTLVKKNPKTVLFICLGNACRSAMAEKIVTDRYSNVQADSAGTHEALPNIGMDQCTIDVMQEIDIDIAGHKPKHLTKVTGTFDVIVNMSPHSNEDVKTYADAFEVFGREWIRWEVEDPRGKDIEVYRTVRDILEAKISNLFFRGSVEPYVCDSCKRLAPR